MSDKRNGFIADNDLVLYGEKIIVGMLNQSNVVCYLSTYKRASAFSKIYEMMPDFWEHPCGVLKIMLMLSQQLHMRLEKRYL